MRLYFLLLCSCLASVLPAQTETDTTTTPRDTTIYRFADEAPRFPTACERYDTTAAAKNECSDVAVLRYVNERAGYPEEARRQNITGMAVIGFVVETNGYVSRAEILRDPGGGIGLSALRAVAEMARDVQWRPAVKDSAFVRFYYTLPIRFKLEEPKPYVVSGRDTIYLDLTKAPRFLGEEGSLSGFFDARLQYPAAGEDSCRIGRLDLQLLVDGNGLVRVQDILDYNDLGTDFTFEAISVATAAGGKWEPGEFEGRPVTSAYNISVNFVPESDGCASTVAAYQEAIDLVNEGQVLLQDSTTLNAGLKKLDLAIDRFPRDGRFRIIRGEVRMANNMLSGACEDLRLAKEISLVDSYDAVLPVLCSQAEE